MTGAPINHKMLFIAISLVAVTIVSCNESKILDVEPNFNETENESSITRESLCVLLYTVILLDDTSEMENNSSGKSSDFASNCQKIDWEKVADVCSETNDSYGIKMLRTACKFPNFIQNYEVYSYAHKYLTNVELQISSGFMIHKYSIMLEELSSTIHNYNEYLKPSILFQTSLSKVFGINSSTDYYEKKKYLQELDFLIKYVKREIHAKTNNFYHVQTPILVIMLILGLLGNSLLLIMFVRHAELRTSQNILIINLTISDLLNLIINLILNYILNINHVEHFWNPGHKTCKTIIQFLYTSVGLSTWSVVVLSVQRLTVIMMPLRRHTSKNCLSEKHLTMIYVISVWVLAVLLALPSSVPSEMDVFGYCSAQLNARFLSLWNLMWYSLLPPVIVVVNYTLTAWRLAAEIKNLPEQAETQRRGRRRSARILLALTVVFMISYFPLFLYFFLETWDIIYPSLKPDSMASESDFILGSICRALFFSNSALNPIALFVSSNVFRKYFKLYCHCCPNQHEGNQNKVI